MAATPPSLANTNASNDLVASHNFPSTNNRCANNRRTCVSLANAATNSAVEAPAKVGTFSVAAPRATIR